MTFGHFLAFHLLYTILFSFSFVNMHQFCVVSTKLFSYFINILIMIISSSFFHYMINLLSHIQSVNLFQIKQYLIIYSC